jgi:hypothetical protein
LARDPTGAIRAADLPGEAIGDLASGPASQVTHETFSALDAETATASPTWIHAGVQRAEAGFHDSALGWVGVRADSGVGGVHASLVPDSAYSAQALDGHMAGLNAYLVEQHTPVETLTVAAPENRAVPSGMDQTGSQGMHQGAGHNPGHSNHSEAPMNTGPGISAATAPASSIEASPAGNQDAGASAPGSGGLHISVMV